MFLFPQKIEEWARFKPGPPGRHAPSLPPDHNAPYLTTMLLSYLQNRISTFLFGENVGALFAQRIGFEDPIKNVNFFEKILEVGDGKSFFYSFF